MLYRIKNKVLSLDIEEPGTSYRGSRFDWTGQVIQITYLGKHTFCTTESLNEESIGKLGRGLYNEFGIDQPVGYDECKVGDKFYKIGVGLLTKESSEPYNFFREYEIKPYSFCSSFENTKAAFCCNSGEDQEYSFKLNKRIELLDNAFTIFYTLQNNGKQEIRTNEYIHNFLSINKREINQSYKLIFPFKLHLEKMQSIVNPDNVSEFGEDFITWNSIPTNQFFIDSVNTDYKEKGEWILVNVEEKVAIQEKCDLNIQKINVWGASHVVSPEIFVQLSISPGESLSWARTFKIFTLN